MHVRTYVWVGMYVGIYIYMYLSGHAFGLSDPILLQHVGHTAGQLHHVLAPLWGAKQHRRECHDQHLSTWGTVDNQLGFHHRWKMMENGDFTNIGHNIFVHRYNIFT